MIYVNQIKLYLICKFLSFYSGNDMRFFLKEIWFIMQFQVELGNDRSHNIQLIFQHYLFSQPKDC